MSEQLTDEAVKALLDGATPGPWRVSKESRHVVDVFAGDRDVVNIYGGGVGLEYRDANANLIAAAPDLARALLDARAENARLRADAQAAVALAVPVAWKYRWKIDGEYVGWKYSDASNTHPSLDGYEEQPLYSAPADGLAAVEALQRDVHNLVAAIRDSWDERDRLAAELAAAQQREAGLAAAEADYEARILAALEVTP